MKETKNLMAIGLLSILFLTSCGKDEAIIQGPPSSTINPIERGDVITATFIDSAVEGLSYQGLTSGMRGETDNKGQFSCEKDEDVQFFIGTLDLGFASCEEFITPEKMENNKLLATNIGMVLLSLDINGDSSDGITIPPKIRNQNYVSASLPTIIDDLNAVENVIFDLINGAPLYTFYGGGRLFIREEVRDHYLLSFIPMGRYEGRITSFSTNLPDGECDVRKLIRAQVGADSITFPGFAGLNPDELSVTIPRTLKYSIFFSSTVELSQFESRDSNNVISPRLYERFHIEGEIIENKLSANFELGDINDQGDLVPSCAGTFELVKEESIPVYYPVRRLTKSIVSNVNGMTNIITAADYGTQMYQMAIDLNSNYAPPYLDCVLAESVAQEVSYNCYPLKLAFEEKFDDLVNYIEKKKATNLFISDELIDLGNETARQFQELNELIY